MFKEDYLRYDYFKKSQIKKLVATDVLMEVSIYLLYVDYKVLSIVQ